MKFVQCVKCGKEIELLNFEYVLNPRCWKCKEKIKQINEDKAKDTENNKPLAVI